MSIRKTVITILIMTMVMMPLMSNAEAIDTGRNVTLKISSGDGSKIVEGMQISIYKLASVGENTDIRYTEDFNDLGLDFTLEYETDEMISKAKIISNAIDNRGIDAIDRCTVKSDGKCLFPDGDNVLYPGIYLVSGGKAEKDGYEYEISPMIISLPQANDDGTYEYDVEIFPKEGKYTKAEEEKLPQKLPQTGQNMFVPISIAGAGVVCLIIGILRRKAASK